MSDITPVFGNMLLRWFANQAVMVAPPGGIWLAIFNGNPRTAGFEIGAQINSANPRQEIIFATLAAGTAHLLTSNNSQNWGNSANGPLNASHLGVFDSATPGSGVMYFSRAINNGPITIGVNSLVTFNAGAVTFNLGSDT
jgi:hypothetical protein